jgi:hypothetical protein
MAASFKKGSYQVFFAYDSQRLGLRNCLSLLFCKFRFTPTKVPKEVTEDHLWRWLPPFSMRKFQTFPS